jgi:hypothetical protein
MKRSAGSGKSKKQDDPDQPRGQDHLAEAPAACLEPLHNVPSLTSPAAPASSDFISTRDRLADGFRLVYAIVLRQAGNVKTLTVGEAPGRLVELLAEAHEGEVLS